MDINTNNIVAGEILNQEGEFGVERIFINVKDKLLPMFDDNEELLRLFVKNKIKAMWKSKLLTYTGYSYYVNM